jgi:hypothetical protein
MCGPEKSLLIGLFLFLEDVSSRLVPLDIRELGSKMVASRSPLVRWQRDAAPYSKKPIPKSLINSDQPPWRQEVYHALS